MPTFEVFIPAKDADSMNVTLTVDAPNWIGALRTGLSNIGEGQDAMSNVMCDIKEDNSIHVTNPNTNRVFRLRELGEGQAASAEVEVDAEEVVAETATPPEPEPVPTPAPSAEPIKAAPAPPPKRTTGQFAAAPEASDVEESAPNKTDPSIGREQEEPDLDINDVIADVFDATQDLLMEETLDAQKVCDTLLDLALAKVPADAGTFYMADISTKELNFQAVRGPKAKDIQKKKLSIKVGQGIVGFAAQEGVCLVIEDMQHDKRYFSKIADAVGYQPKNTLCASAEKEGRLYGAIQLINAKEGRFTGGQMEVIRYIGLTAADMLARVAEQGVAGADIG